MEITKEETKLFAQLLSNATVPLRDASKYTEVLKRLEEDIKETNVE